MSLPNRLAALLALATALPAPAAGTFRAGVAAVDVSPAELPAIVNGGFLRKDADAVRDPLFARAFVIDDGATRLALCVVDTCMMPRDLIDQAKDLARTCALNALAAIEALVGLDSVVRVVKVVGFVASTPEFTGQPAVVNGASELLGDVFGDAGRHARSAVGVAALPLDAPVEVELVVETLYTDESGERTIWRWKPLNSGPAAELGEEVDQ